jgi:hypothetical protein
MYCILFVILYGCFLYPSFWITTNHLNENKMEYKTTCIRGKMYHLVPVIGLPEMNNQESTVIEVCANYYGINKSRLFGTEKTGAVVQCRFMCYYLIERLCGLNRSHIAKLFNRDHSGISSALKRLNGYIDIGDITASQAEQLESKILLTLNKKQANG